jgi:putative ABC transport system permease protein
VIVNQRLVEEHFPAEDPLGRRIQLLSDGAGGARDVSLTIVGISSSVRRSSSDDGDPVVYRPYRATPPASGVLLLRVAGDSPTAVAPAVREEVRRLDANLPLYRVMAVEQALHEARWNGRVSATIIYTISTIAFVLALVGMFAVTAHSVIQRTPEIGLRIAVGAGTIQIVRLILRRAFVQLSMGLSLGVVFMFLLQSILPIAASTREDAAILFGLIAIITLVTMSACIVPALKAARVDPVKALRSE